MEFFKNTNFDFLRYKWPFIGASLVLTAAGLISLGVKGGPKYGIDFHGGGLLRVRFQHEPPMEQIRSALAAKIHGDISVQQLTGTPEVLVGTEVTNDTELNANQQTVIDTLRTMFGGEQGKVDLNNSGSEDVKNALLQANVPLSDDDLTKVVAAIESYRSAHSGLLNSIDELSSVSGVTPQIITALKSTCTLGQFTMRGTESVGPKVGKELTNQAIRATLYALAGMLVRSEERRVGK